ncbi:hypothetical protein OHA21_40015 [Actinoplanes sp. NBC_00393]|uniref:hypothetical protein n=1 Tax=Actinoplanes sp. NBC_00393 TaxID=2975953 RepID=UPI002E1E69F6
MAYAIGMVAIAPATVDRFRAATSGTDQVESFIAVIWIDAAVAAVVAVLAIALFAVLGVGLRRGSRVARGVTLGVCGLGVLAGCGSLLTIALQRSGDALPGSVGAALGAAYPDGWINLNVAVASAQVLAYVAVAALVLLAPRQYFGHCTVTDQAGNVGAFPGYGQPAYGLAYPQPGHGPAYPQPGFNSQPGPTPAYPQPGHSSVHPQPGHSPAYPQPGHGSVHPQPGPAYPQPGYGPTYAQPGYNPAHSQPGYGSAYPQPNAAPGYGPIPSSGAGAPGCGPAPAYPGSGAYPPASQPAYGPPAGWGYPTQGPPDDAAYMRPTTHQPGTAQSPATDEPAVGQPAAAGAGQPAAAGAGQPADASQPPADAGAGQRAASEPTAHRSNAAQPQTKSPTDPTSHPTPTPQSDTSPSIDAAHQPSVTDTWPTPAPEWAAAHYAPKPHPQSEQTTRSSEQTGDTPAEPDQTSSSGPAENPEDENRSQLRD